MRLYWIGLPAGLALASAGLLLYTQAVKPHYSSGEILQPQPRHPVTNAMLSDSAHLTRKVAAAFKVKSVDGEAIVLGAAQSDKPQFVYFVLDGCPCSFDAEPLFQDLYKHLAGAVDFVSVTDAGPENAKRWWHQMTVPYPVVSDPDLEIMRAYEAKASVYSALVSKNGHIVKAWPGYSADILTEMNRLMSREAGVPEKPFDTKYAPKLKSSGCKFVLK